ncbi:hypothetical protein PSACC_00435 [Paramicrosporidium saccamoebae]|uniref:SANTA domain-containing protein n=1 Tax=Paramicrosporidium saccamoebae TaxID=1246581 RepID=A0A2H9TPW4_9FUNG|nr:hypothetical protein PSACC_00435 [Paramicrosporidium saccamoebae]
MERRSDDIFRVHDLSVLKSPMPVHLMKPSSSSSPTPVRPIPKQNVSPFGLSALAANMINRTPATKSQAAEGKVGWSPLGTGSEQSLDLAHSVKGDNNITPKFETPTLKIASGSSLPTVGQAIQAALNETSPLQGDKVKDTIHDSMGLDSTNLMQCEKPEDTDTIAMKLDKASSLGEEEIVCEPMEVDEASLLKQKETTHDSSKLSKSPKLTPSENVSASRLLPVQKRKSKPDLAPDAENVEKRPVVKSVATGSEITLLKWSMVVVPNNPNVTKLEKLVTENWIVLVGRRSDMTELWHSSLITNRLSNREITTGSGRIYKLEGPCDDLAMIESGFNFDIIEAFREGFPENWQMVLIQELGGAFKDKSNREKKPEVKDKLSHEKKSETKDDFHGKRLETTNDSHEKKQDVKDDDFENQCPQINRIKTVNRRKSMPSSKPKTAPKIKSPQKSTLITPKSRRNAASKYETSPKSSRRYSEPLSRWNDLPSFSCNVQVTGHTRSGRRVVSPLPYWENKYFRSYGASPSSTALERRKDSRD